MTAASTLTRAPHLNLARPQLANAARELARGVGLWRPALRFSREQRVHTRLCADEHMEAWLLSWMPGQGTQVHDHGGSAGAITSVSGRLRGSVPAEAHQRGPAAAWLVAGSVRTFPTRSTRSSTARTPPPSASTSTPRGCGR